MSRIERIQNELGDVAAGARLCQRQLVQIRNELEGRRSPLAIELRRTAETFITEFESASTVLQTAAGMTEEDLGEEGGAQ